MDQVVAGVTAALRRFRGARDPAAHRGRARAVTVLLTGGAGFIGQHLARHLAAVRFDVAAVDLLHRQVHADPDAAREAFPGPVVVGDVADRLVWTTAAAQVRRVEALVHLAAETGAGQSMYEVDRYHRVNVEGTRRAAEFAVGHGIPLVLISARAVYGEGRHECPEHRPTFGRPCCAAATPAPSREDDPHHPVSVYGETKSLGESVATAVCADRVPLTIVRPQNVIGPGQSLHNPHTGVLAAFLAMLREGRPLTVYGDGRQTRDFVHVDDVAALLTHLVSTPPVPGAPLVLNSGTGVRTSLVDLAGLAADAAPVPSAGIVHVEVHRAGDIEHACADLTRLTSVGVPRGRPTRPRRRCTTSCASRGTGRAARPARGSWPSASWRSEGSPRERRLPRGRTDPPPRPGGLAPLAGQAAAVRPTGPADVRRAARHRPARRARRLRGADPGRPGPAGGGLPGVPLPLLGAGRARPGAPPRGQRGRGRGPDRRHRPAPARLVDRDHRLCAGRRREQRRGRDRGAVDGPRPAARPARERRLRPRTLSHRPARVDHAGRPSAGRRDDPARLERGGRGRSGAAGATTSARWWSAPNCSGRRPNRHRAPPIPTLPRCSSASRTARSCPGRCWPGPPRTSAGPRVPPTARTPRERDRRSVATHARWEAEGITIDRSGIPLRELGAPVVSVFSTGVLEAAAAGLPAWVTLAEPADLVARALGALRPRAVGWPGDDRPAAAGGRALASRRGRRAGDDDAVRIVGAGS